MNLRQLTVFVQFGYVNMRAITFLFVEVFLALPNFRGESSKIVPTLSPLPRGT